MHDQVQVTFKNEESCSKIIKRKKNSSSKNNASNESDKVDMEGKHNCLLCTGASGK